MSLTLNLNCTREIKRFVVHATGGPANQSLESIKAGWKAMGWRNPGYHFLIDPDGTVHQLAKLDTICNGVKGYNTDSIHVCYKGGGDKGYHGLYIDSRTDDQKYYLREILVALRAIFPDTQIMGHRDLSPDTDGDGVIEFHEWIKECPCFDAIPEYEDI